MNSPSNIKTSFQRTLVRAQQESGQTKSTFWESHGIERATIRGYLNDPNRRPLRQVVEKLAPVLKRTVAELEKMCGGLDDRRRRAIRDLPSRRGIRASKETKRKMSEARKGRPMSEANRLALSKSAKARMQDPAKRAKLVAQLTALGSLEPRIKAMATRWGREYVQQHMDQLIERYAEKFSLRKKSVRGIISRTISEAPRAGKKLKGSKADIIRTMHSDGRTNAQIVQEGARRREAGDSGWTYQYVYTVLNRA